MAGAETAEVLFTEYLISHRAGEVDPVPFLDRADPDEREVLATLIDAYLVQAPGRAWDPEAFNGTAAQRMVEPLSLALSGVSGAWPIILPRLRHRARIKRRDLAARLADGLGFPKTTATVEDYYHAMEHGDLPADGVSNKVLDALAKLLGSDPDSLRRAGALILSGSAKGDPAVFARHPSISALEDSGAVHSIGAAIPSDSVETSRTDEDQADEDEIDRLFTGGIG